MGPEEDEDRVRPGKVWLVPVGDDGEPMGEPQEMTGGATFGWGDDWGVDQGLHGGLEGGPSGALGDDRLVMDSTGLGKTTSMSFTIDPDRTEEVMALIWGITVAEYRDFKRWVFEKEWLERVTDGVWGLT